MDNNVRMRRIIACIIDWWLSLLPCLIYVISFYRYFIRPSFQNIVLMLIFILLVFLLFITFIFRDVICKGRSIGKQIFGLHIIDKSTNESASIRQRIIRNLFFFLPIDGIVLLATKESIGDRVTNTIVVKK